MRTTNPYASPRLLFAQPVRREVLSPAAFLALKASAPGDIAACRAVPPVLGRPGFGGVEVTYTRPRYRTAP